MRCILLLVALVSAAMIAGPAAPRAADDEIDQALATVRGQLGEEQPLEALKALMWLVYEVWDRLPLTLKHATLVETEPSGYGVYAPKQNPVYRNDEPIYAYLEPVGYGFAETDDLASFGFAADLLVLSETGAVIGGQRDFGQFAFRSRVANLETFLFFEVTLSGLPAGTYGLEFDVRDQVSEERARAHFDIQIAE